MVFILGINVAENRTVAKALQGFFGIGPNIAARLMAKLSIHKTAVMASIPQKTVTKIETELTKMTIENDLRRQILENISRLRTMGTYRGRRHAVGLPVRGQNTKSQIRTAKKLNKLDRRLGGQLITD